MNISHYCNKRYLSFNLLIVPNNEILLPGCSSRNLANQVVAASIRWEDKSNLDSKGRISRVLTRAKVFRNHTDDLAQSNYRPN